MSDDKIDFAPLDPAGEPLRFERMVRSVMAGLEASRAPHPITTALRAFGRPALVTSFAAAASLWVVALASPRTDGATTREPPADPLALLSEWAQAGAIPDGADVLKVLEGIHAE